MAPGEYTITEQESDLTTRYEIPAGQTVTVTAEEATTVEFYNALLRGKITGQKNYGKEGAEIIVDNVQLTIFGGFAPNSETAQAMSKSLGNRTVQTGYISKGKDNGSQSLQMMERLLMTPDELKSMPKGQFIVMKTGAHPMKVKLKLFFQWGISFGAPYTVPDKGNRPVAYVRGQRGFRK